jgi:hypothetical protein
VALYIPAARRRRRLLVAAAAALIVGLAVGLVVGRSTVPTVHDRVSDVRTEARDISAGLRVLSLHISAKTSGDSVSEVDLVLRKTRARLTGELDKAAWIGPGQRVGLMNELTALAARTDRTSAGFGVAADRMAKDIDVMFGVS